MGIQASPEVAWKGSGIPACDSNCLMSLPKMEDFIRLATKHAARCGEELVLIDRDMTCGAYVKETWKCPCCEKEIQLANCDMVRSDVVAEGAAYSRSQPEVNLRIAATAGLLTGTNLQKVQEIITGQLGVKVATDKNLRKQRTKGEAAIKAAFEDCKSENRKKAVEATRASDQYVGDLEFVDENGDSHSVACCQIAIDGAGATRAYQHRITGKQAALVANDMATGLPVALHVSTVSLLL